MRERLPDWVKRLLLPINQVNPATLAAISEQSGAHWVVDEHIFAPISEVPDDSHIIAEAINSGVNKG